MSNECICAVCREQYRDALGIPNRCTLCLAQELASDARVADALSGLEHARLGPEMVIACNKLLDVLRRRVAN